jgi:hypothetical protein
LDVHEIRLRGGWECVSAAGIGASPMRLTLPIRGDALPSGRLRLNRRFNRPPRVADVPVELRMRNVPGIESVLLNGLALGPISPEHPELDLALGNLEPRNELVILANPPGDAVDWGFISLVFGEPMTGAGGLGRTAIGS